MTQVTTSATYKTLVTANLPDFGSRDITFRLVAAFFNAAGEEVIDGKTYTMTLDASGVDDGSFYLPTPDNTGAAGANWFVTLPSGFEDIVTVAYSGTAQAVSDLLAAGSTTTDPDVITALVASKATKVTGATAGNLASLTSGGDLADSGAAAANVPTGDEKSWLTASEAGGALGTAAYAATGDFDAAGSAAARVAKTGDTMTGNLTMANVNTIYGGDSTGGVLSRPYLEFQSPGALVEGKWRQQQVTIGAEKYDNSLRWTYNSAWNASTTNDSRLIDGEHTILYGLESRWTSGGDPTAMRGQVEWYLRISPATTGAISNHEAFAVLYDMDNERTAVQLGSTLDTENSVLVNNGNLKIAGSNSAGWGLQVTTLPIWADGGIKITGTNTIEGVYASGGSSSYSQWIKSQIYATAAGSVAFTRIGDGKFGYASEAIATAIGLWVHGNSVTKGTSGTVTRTSALTLTRPTIGNGNAALTFGNGNDVANPGFANYNIYQINTDPNYFAGMVRAASFGAGNLAANTATPSGATAYAMPIYNASGTLQGYIPVYAAQWS